MRPCKKCKANRWKFWSNDKGYVTATCQNCKTQVGWMPKNARALVATKKDQIPTSLKVKDGFLVF